MSVELRAFLRLLLRALIVLIAVLITIWAGPAVWLALSPFIIAFFIAHLLQKPITLFTSRLRMHRTAASIIWTFMFYIAVAAAVYLIVHTSISQLLQAANNYQHLITGIIGMLESATDWVLGFINNMDPGLQETLNSAFTSVSTWLTNVISETASGIIKSTVDFASHLPTAFIYANFLIFGTYFIAKDYGRIRKRINDMFAVNTNERVRLTLTSLRKGVFGYLKVETIYALMVIVISSAVLSIYGQEYSLIIAFILAVLEFLPLFANGTLLIPWSIVCFLIGDISRGIMLAVLYLVQMSIRRFTEPKLLSSNMGLTPIASLIGMYAGTRLYGVLGLIFGPIAILVLINIYRANAFEGMTADAKCVFKGISRWLKRRDC